MLERRHGHLVLVASLAGYRGLPTAGGYAASKAGLIALAESLKLDLDGTGVRVSLVNPGFVDTPLTRKNPFPMPDIITAEAAAIAIEQGLASGRFETAFPWRFALIMKLLRLLPDRLYFPIVHKVTGQ
jgi:short-subunit dehydrogenase